MYRFFAEREQVNTEEKKVYITGDDYNHMKNVLRLKPGEEVSVVVPGEKREVRCGIDGYSDDTAILTIRFVKEADVELPCEVVLFQALPKADKMELVIQKAVELGAWEIVPVKTERCIVKLDDARAKKKVERWNAISSAAAKQSKRAFIPRVSPVCSFSEALEKSSRYDTKIMPYELCDPESMDTTRDMISSVKPGAKVAVFIGPEGGFTDEETELAKKAGFMPITLGRRILRTETAGFVVLSWLVLELEGKK